MDSTSRSATGVISSKADLSPELLAKYEAYVAKKNAPNALYETQAQAYGKFSAPYTGPEHARAGNFSKYFLSKKGILKSTLDTSVAKSKFPTR